MKPFTRRGRAISLAVIVAHRRQRGISLMMVMISIVLMSLAAVGLIRMVDTGSLIVGNVAFKQSTTAAADSAVEEGIASISDSIAANAAYGHSDQVDDAYYATSLNELDPTGNATARHSRVLIDWNMDQCSYASDGTYARCITPSDPPINSNGYSVRFLVTRLCKMEGDSSATTNDCIRSIEWQTSGESDGRGIRDYRTPTHLSAVSNGGDVAPPLYRVIARSVGPRNTVSVTETYVQF